MGKSNTEQLKIAQKYLGKGGATFRKFCGLPSGAAWCNAFVCYIFNEGGNASLYYGGKKVTYCPTSIKWCYSNLAQIPIYLALPMDVIYFDWEPNGIPNHIGFVRERKSDQEVYTIEGNTSGGIVANKTRTVKYVNGCFRPHYKPSGFSASKKLDVDGYFGYNSIAVMQRWLGVTQDAILKRSDIVALQKKLSISQDGSWGKNTSKALQKLIGTTADGAFGPKSVKAFQTYLNKKVFPSSVTTKSVQDKACEWARSIAGDNSWVYVVRNNSVKKTFECPICHNHAKGKYHGWNCIGFVGACYHHGAGISISCENNGILTTAFAGKMLKSSDAKSIWEGRNGKGWSVIKNGYKVIPASSLKKGDIVICFDKTGSSATYKHVAIYLGDGMIADATSSSGISVRKYSSLGTKALMAVRYTK